MRKTPWALLACATLLWIAAPLWAHHGNAGRYDDKLTTVHGTVVELEMINPHSIIVVDVPGTNGKLTRWQAEMQGPTSLSREFGWTRDTLKPGDKITLIGRRVRSGAPYMNLTEQSVVYMTDSKRLLYKSRDAKVPDDVVASKTDGSVPEAPAH